MEVHRKMWTSIDKAHAHFYKGHVNFNIGDNYGQHPFMNIDTRYPVRHKRSSWPGAESVLRLL